MLAREGLNGFVSVLECSEQRLDRFFSRLSEIYVAHSLDCDRTGYLSA